VVKTFNYRAGTRDFSNRYHFTGGTPSGSTPWTTLSDAVVTAEKAIFPAIGSGGATIVATYGYAAGSDVPVFSKTYSTAGTLSSTGFYAAPGDCAALIRYSTAGRTSKNHPLYLFNYVHAVGNAGLPTTGDTLNASQRTAMGTYAGLWVAGFSDGSHTCVRSGPDGDSATGYLVNSQITHRDFPRG
jgi:hypothetical protein